MLKTIQEAPQPRYQIYQKMYLETVGQSQSRQSSPTRRLLKSEKDPDIIDNIDLSMYHRETRVKDYSETQHLH